jgi:hypothetical protein
MIDAAKNVIGEKWPDVKTFAESEFINCAIYMAEISLGRKQDK